MTLFAHLLNGYTGSPRILRLVVRLRLLAGDDCSLMVGAGSNGVLDDCGCPVSYYWYRRSANQWLTLGSFLASQALLFVRLFVSARARRHSVVYVNTMLPFGVALFGRLTGRKVIYHLHEVAIGNPLLTRALLAIVRTTADSVIFVSEYHRDALDVGGVRSFVLPNVLEPGFAGQALAADYLPRRHGGFRILMLASLRAYKGLQEFIELARSLQSERDLTFLLVISDEKEAADRYFKSLPDNIEMHAACAEPSRFYSTASVVVNLSRVDQWLETFGLTILEAMAYGIPVVVPPAGGPAELIREGIEGFKVDSRDAGRLKACILSLANDSQLCTRMSAAARRRAREFSYEDYSASLQQIMSATTGHGG